MTLVTYVDWQNDKLVVWATKTKHTNVHRDKIEKRKYQNFKFKNKIFFIPFFSSWSSPFVANFFISLVKTHLLVAMSFHSIANSSSIELPIHGYNKVMRMFITNSNEKPKRRYWNGMAYLQRKPKRTQVAQASQTSTEITQDTQPSQTSTETAQVTDPIQTTYLEFKALVADLWWQVILHYSCKPLTEKHVKNNVRWPVVTTPTLNCYFSSSNDRKTNVIMYFLEKIYLFKELLRSSSHLIHIIDLLTSLHSSRTCLEKIAHILNHTFFLGYTYVSPKVSRASHNICPLKSLDECTLL